MWQWFRRPAIGDVQNGLCGIFFPGPRPSLVSETARKGGDCRLVAALLRAARGCAVLGLSLVAACSQVNVDRRGAATGSVSLAALDSEGTEDANPAAERMDPISSAGDPGVPLHRHLRRERGIASYYGPEFFWRKMANGRRFDPGSISAAHKTLPLGSVVVVRNLENNRSVVVRVEDRGPYVEGRIIDVTPRTAQQLGMINRGIVAVEVTPVELAEAR